MNLGKSKTFSVDPDPIEQPSKITTVAKSIISPHVEPTPRPTPTITPSEDSDPMKTNCAYCKAEMVANLAFRFGLVLVVLAFSFKLIKTAK